MLPGSRFACSGSVHRHIDLPVAPPLARRSGSLGRIPALGTRYPQSNLDSHTGQLDSTAPAGSRPAILDRAAALPRHLYMEEICQICEGSGLRIMQENG